MSHVCYSGSKIVLCCLEYGLICPGMNQWVGPPPKDMNMSGTGSNKTGWEEPSPPAQRRNLPNYDDGTSLWGNPAQQQSRMGGTGISKMSHSYVAPLLECKILQLQIVQNKRE